MRRIVFTGCCLLILCVNSFGQAVDSLRIITYNIHHANPPSRPGVIDMQAFIDLFKKYPADVIALQEVDVNTKRSGTINEAKIIADALGMHYFFAKAIDHDGGYYGVALLSRFPFKDSQVVRLPMDSTMKGEQRVLAAVTIALPSKRLITIGCTHLDHQADERNRRLQMETILSIAGRVHSDFVLAGDLNAEEASGVISKMDKKFQRTCKPCERTFPADVPVKTIDYIAFKRSKKIKALSHSVLPDTYASDHRPVRAVLQFR